MTQPSQSRGTPGSTFSDPACVLLPKAVMTTVVPNYLQKPALIALSIAYVAQPVDTKMTTVARVVDDACALVYLLLFTDQGRHQFAALDDLETVLSDIHKYVINNASDNIIVRMIRARKIEKSGKLLQERLEDLTGRFGCRRSQQIILESAPHVSPSIVSNSPQELDERQSEPASGHNLSIMNSIVQVINAPHSGNTNTTSATNSHNDSSHRYDDWISVHSPEEGYWHSRADL
ncbi:hypothetical protein H0H92_000975 [Tricholoma furcatifolium]|nr:hypothetical protein H0H92_000975 [Tricholoma furcatifolium]